MFMGGMGYFEIKRIAIPPYRGIAGERRLPEFCGLKSKTKKI
jgi:hypothetical protein